MKRFIAILLSILIVITFSGMAFAQPKNIPNSNGKKSLVALGDSISVGYGIGHGKA